MGTLSEARRVSGAAAATMREAMGHRLTPQIMLEQHMRREARRALNRRRYERQFARRSPEPARPPRARSPVARRSIGIPSFERFMQSVVASLYGAKGTWGHGRHVHLTARGPGLRPKPRKYRQADGSPLVRREHPTGTKLVRQIIRHGFGEQVDMRRLYARKVGRQYNE